jgi:hypothetical protein
MTGPSMLVLLDFSAILACPISGGAPRLSSEDYEALQARPLKGPRIGRPDLRAGVRAAANAAIPRRPDEVAVRAQQLAESLTLLTQLTAPVRRAQGRRRTPGAGEPAPRRRRRDVLRARAARDGRNGKEGA